jgi:isoquinoline 1-oxidoreductase subunit beta
VPAKSNGIAQFTLDVTCPGMLVAVLQRPPLFGATVKSYDATAAKAVPGVVEVVQVPRGVAVVGKSFWAAKKGRDALKVDWNAHRVYSARTDRTTGICDGPGCLDSFRGGIS